MVPDIALAASARQWPDRLHRYLLDHGGGRIAERIMSADQTSECSSDVLLIDDVCSFLTPRLVTVLKQSGVEVIGVYMPEDGSDAKRRLLECGISDVIETEAGPEEFLAKITSTLDQHVDDRVEARPSSSPALRVGVTGPCAGVGITELAVSLAWSLAEEIETVLIDMDQSWPSVAQRLDLPLHPNIRTAIDHALHRMDRMEESVQDLDGLSVVGGRADGGRGTEITRPEATMLMDALSGVGAVLVVDLGPLADSERGLMREFDTVIVVGCGTPVGVARLIKTVEAIQARDSSLSLLVAVNKTPRGSYRRSELVSEIRRAFADMPAVTVPFDPRLDESAWDGGISIKGRFGRAIRSMSGAISRSLA